MFAFLAEDVQQWWYNEGATILTVAILAFFTVLLAVVIAAYSLVRPLK